MQMLRKNRKHRLGYGPLGGYDILRHQFFEVNDDADADVDDDDVDDDDGDDDDDGENDDEDLLWIHFWTTGDEVFNFQVNFTPPGVGMEEPL